MGDFAREYQLSLEDVFELNDCQWDIKMAGLVPETSQFLSRILQPYEEARERKRQEEADREEVRSAMFD